jgi:hypothetical protein
MAKLKLVLWRDIPGQVVIRKSGRSTRLRLSLRFMRAIERASYRLKKTQADAFFEPWHDIDQSFEGDISIAAKNLIAQIEDQFTDDVLDSLIRSSGIKEDKSEIPEGNISVQS